MKITKELFKKMEICCRASVEQRHRSDDIDTKLKNMGVDIDKMRNDDVVLADMLDYGNWISKEEVEKALDSFLLVELSEHNTNFPLNLKQDLPSDELKDNWGNVVTGDEKEIKEHLDKNYPEERKTEGEGQ